MTTCRYFVKYTVTNSIERNINRNELFEALKALIKNNKASHLELTLQFFEGVNPNYNIKPQEVAQTKIMFLFQFKAPLNERLSKSQLVNITKLTKPYQEASQLLTASFGKEFYIENSDFLFERME